jgi:hypothetical protein
VVDGWVVGWGGGGDGVGVGGWDLIADSCPQNIINIKQEHKYGSQTFEIIIKIIIIKTQYVN